MAEHLLQHLEGHRCDVGSGLRRFKNVRWMAQAGRYYLRIYIVIIKNIYDVANKLHAVFADVVEASDERADIRRAGRCGE